MYLLTHEFQCFTFFLLRFQTMYSIHTTNWLFYCYLQLLLSSTMYDHSSQQSFCSAVCEINVVQSKKILLWAKCTFNSGGLPLFHCTASNAVTGAQASALLPTLKPPFCNLCCSETVQLSKTALKKPLNPLSMQCFIKATVQF